MSPEVRKCVDRMSVANRVFIDALRARDDLLAETCESASKTHMKTAVTAAGIKGKVGWHTFRHSYRSWLQESAVQQELMRHASITTTMNVYGKALTGYQASSQQQGCTDGVAGLTIPAANCYRNLIGVCGGLSMLKFFVTY
jgi:integrase